MAIAKSALTAIGGFDPIFDRAGDDTDLSIRLREHGDTLAHAAGAVVIHKRRSTIGDYLRQQRGYGAAEGALFRKYPRSAERPAIYGDGSWFTRWFGGERIYYGAFGRGLFQSIYSGQALPLAVQMPLTAQWVTIAIVLVLCGIVSPVLGAIGCAGIVLTLASAVAGAMLDSAESGRLTPSSRAILAILYLLGPLVRSYERSRVRLRFEPRLPSSTARRMHLKGTIGLSAIDGRPAIANHVIDTIRGVLLSYGLIVAKTEGFEPYDLELWIPPGVRVAINALRDRGNITIRYRLGIAAVPILTRGLMLLIILLLAGVPIGAIVLVLGLAGCGITAIALWRASLIPAILESAAAEAGNELGLRAEPARNLR